MNHFALAIGPEAWATGLGIGFSALVIASLLLRWYRMRQEFAIMKMALEKGLAGFPPALPQWLISLRQGMLIATLGIGLATIGGIGYWIAAAVVMPDTPMQIANVSSTLESLPPPPPPPPNPQLEKWHRAQDQQIICSTMIGGGVVLLMLGLVRIAFVPAERNYAARWAEMNIKSPGTPSHGI